MKLLEMKNVQKSFGGLEVLKDISLDVNKGEVVAIIGPSGSGKSTFLRCATLLETMDKGTLCYGGKYATTNKPDENTSYVGKKDMLEVKSQFGLVFQNFNLFPHYTVLKNIIDAPVHVQGKSKEETEKTARALLKKVGLESKEDSYPSQLSGGQQQRVSIGRALINEPAFILADEPTGNLDSKTSREILDILKFTNQKYKQTILLVTHDEKIALQANRIITIGDGKIIKDEVMK